MNAAGQGPPTARELTPAYVALALAVGLGAWWLLWCWGLLGGVGLVLGGSAYLWLLVRLVRWRAAAVRRRRGRFTAAEAERLTDGRLPDVVLALLRRDGWRVVSAPYQGRARIVGADRSGRPIDVAFRASTWEEDTLTSGPGPAPLRAAGTVGHGGTVRLVVSLGTYSRGDVLWASRQGGVYLVDGTLLRRWAAGEPVNRLLGIVGGRAAG
ncbi:hypothetical protein ACFC26_41340 [Kitasatospora purpeofusca]|uniref:hypothetical protein n=1 Tax=Kitasatospora purpeofusca TaxID=67352 RepID=UPI0035D9F2E0